MAVKTRQRKSLDPRLKATVPASVRLVQLTLRWSVVIASVLAAITLGNGIDRLKAETPLDITWWGLFTAEVAWAAVSAGLVIMQGLTVQSRAETRFRGLAHDAWFRLGPMPLRDREGAQLDLATNGAMRVARYRAEFLSNSVASLSSTVVVCIIMGVFFGWWVAGWMSLVIVIGPLLVGFFQSRTKESGDEFRASQMKLRATFLEGVNALESLSFAGASRSYARSLAAASEKHRQKIMSLLAENQMLIFVMDIIFSMVAMLLAASLGLVGLHNGALTLGQAISLVIVTTVMVAPVDLIGQFFYIAIGGRATQRQYADLLAEADLAPSIQISDEVILEPGIQADIRIEDVTAGWEEDADLLRNATWHIPAGSHVALVGPSGVGKSTLSALIQGHICPEKGRVIVAGKDTRSYSPSDIARVLAVVEQRTYLFNGTIAENLRLAAPEATDQQLWQALERANLDADVRGFAAGLDTIVGDHGARLSGGQSQRLALARAFLKQAPILILDEPTSQVDLGGESAILEAISRISEDRTVLMIAHRPSAQHNMGAIFELKEKKVAAINGKH